MVNPQNAKLLSHIVEFVESVDYVSTIQLYKNQNVQEIKQIIQKWGNVNPDLFLENLTSDYLKLAILPTIPNLFPSKTTKITFPTPHFDFLIMSNEELKKMNINYCFFESIFGLLLIASTSRGICYLSFDENKEKAIEDLKSYFAEANLQATQEEMHRNALEIFSPNAKQRHSIPLHLKGSEFQQKNWNELLKIPFGEITTYGKIAAQIGNRNAARAVGTAIGSNPIGYIIPCHRVIQNSGNIGGYMWGGTRKKILLAWEKAMCTEK